MAIVSSMWRLWCLRKNLHSCIQVSDIIVVNVNWWFLDGIALSLSSPTHARYLHQNIHTTLTAEAAAVTMLIGLIAEKSQQTMQSFDNELWHLVCRYFSFIYIHPIHLFIIICSVHQKHTHIHTQQTIQKLFFFFVRSDAR